MPMRETELYIELYADALLGKWGFSDGDVLKDWWYEFSDEDVPFDHHDILYALVLEYLMPAIREAGYDVEIYRIYTNHNPVRAEKINGVELSDILRENKEWSFDPDITVKVTGNQILDLIGTLTIKEN